MHERKLYSLLKMEEVKHALYLVCLGMRDSLKGVAEITNLFIRPSIGEQGARRNPGKENPNGRNILLHCASFGFLFVFFSKVYEYYFLGKGFVVLAEYMEIDMRDIVWWQTTLRVLFLFSLTYPLLGVSKVLNFIWCQDIGDLMCEKRGLVKSSTFSVSGLLADLSKSLFVQILFCVQGYLPYFMPLLPDWIKYAWYLFHLSLLSSLYAFEYKWMYIGWPLSRRILTIERKWPYFLGHGLLLACFTTFVSSYIDSTIMFGTVFPFYVLGSTVTLDSQTPTYNRPLHIFKFVDSIADVMISFFLKIGFGR